MRVDVLCSGMMVHPIPRHPSRRLRPDIVRPLVLLYHHLCRVMNVGDAGDKGSQPVHCKRWQVPVTGSTAKTK